MKKIFLIFLLLFLNIILNSLTNEQKNILGYYEYKVEDETQFIKGDYQSYLCIILFEDGRYVKFEKIINQINKTDIKYNPLHCGFFNIYKNFVYLQPTSGLFEIYEIKLNKLIGTYSDFIYSKKD